MNVDVLILCEGVTDQTLLGCYIEAVSGWRFKKNIKNNPFANEADIVWYTNDEQPERLLGIWNNGGDTFNNIINKICERENKEHAIDKMLIITDNDDEEASTIRPKAILDTFNEKLSANIGKDTTIVNRYSTLVWDGIFGGVSMELGYMLVPLDSNGALESFMLDALIENRPEGELVIGQVEQFLEKFKSDIYLKSRRERVKAKLGVTLGIMAPDKSFHNMKELIYSVDWADYKASFEQFALLREVL